MNTFLRSIFRLRGICLRPIHSCREIADAYHQWKHLWDTDDRLLADMGITLEQADRELIRRTAKVFWFQIVLI